MSDLNTPESNESNAELKRCISRLSYVGMGLSNKLDAALVDLRELVKSDESEKKLKKSIDKISKILRNLEDKTELKSTQVDLAVKETNVITLLLEKKLPVKLKIALQKELADNNPVKATEVAMSIASAIDEFLASLDGDNNVSDKSQPEKKSGFFSNLFKKEKNDDDLTLQSKDNELVADKLTQPENLPDKLKDSLQHLVEQLSSMEAYNKVSDKLIKKVSNVKSLTELSEILELITGTFVEVSGIEHKQLETFLKSLNKRIDRVNEFINNTINYSQQVSRDSDLLDKELKNSVSSIKVSVDSSNSLVEVKKNIYSKMDAIIKRVNLFYLQQEKSSKDLSSNLESLQEQLKATESESMRLREDLEAQKMRAQTDPLTQLPNRYSYNEQLNQEYNRWRRYRNALTLVIGDIDFFKKINDEYGHAAGDEVLKQISIFMKEELRESDFIARFGGEEFIILLPETDIIAATKAINKLRLGIKDVVVAFENKKIQFAMSFGISEFEDDDTPKSVFERADKALYRAKEKGRDQVCCQRAKSN